VEEHFKGFWTLHAADDRLAGVAGSERYGATWLLRSLAVDRRLLNAKLRERRLLRRRVQR
jgi:hypothetical protein